MIPFGVNGRSVKSLTVEVGSMPIVNFDEVGVPIDLQKNLNLNQQMKFIVKNKSF